MLRIFKQIHKWTHEDSFLFVILYLLSSNPSINKLYKNVSQFQLSLFNLSQIKQNLISKIPDVIIRKFKSKIINVNEYLILIMELWNVMKLYYMI